MGTGTCIRSRTLSRHLPPLIVCLCLLGAGQRPALAYPIATIHGAGSTFDAPFFARAFQAYSADHPVEIAYRPDGSGAGIEQFIANGLDFAATDVPLNQLELALAVRTDGPVVEIPVALGGVAVIFNDSKIGGTRMLALDGPTLAAVFLGTIQFWDDPAIARLNPGLRLPPDHIRPVHRADSSGTTYMFTNYLSAVSARWARTVGKAKAVAWPVGFRGTGSAGEATWVARHEGAIGYVELKYAIDNHLSYARLRNRAGRFQPPNRATVAAAATRFPRVSPHAFSIINATGAGSYPIAGYSWILVRENQRSAGRGRPLVRLLRWLTTTGQHYASALNYTPLPMAARQQAATALYTVRFPAGGGSP